MRGCCRSAEEIREGIAINVLASHVHGSVSSVGRGYIGFVPHHTIYGSSSARRKRRHGRGSYPKGRGVAIKHRTHSDCTCGIWVAHDGGVAFVIFVDGNIATENNVFEIHIVCARCPDHFYVGGGIGSNIKGKHFNRVSANIISVGAQQYRSVIIYQINIKVVLRTAGLTIGINEVIPLQHDRVGAWL